MSSFLWAKVFKTYYLTKTNNKIYNLSSDLIFHYTSEKLIKNNYN